MGKTIIRVLTMLMPSIRPGGELALNLEAQSATSPGTARSSSSIDRSIPVAFEPGIDHNVHEVIRVRRYLE
jgi:hypothetical protein